MVYVQAKAYIVSCTCQRSLEVSNPSPRPSPAQNCGAVDVRKKSSTHWEWELMTGFSSLACSITFVDICLMINSTWAAFLKVRRGQELVREFKIRESSTPTPGSIHLEYAADLQTSPTEGCIQQSIGRKAVDRAGCIIFKEFVSASKNTNRILTRRVMRSGDKAFCIIARWVVQYAVIIRCGFNLHLLQNWLIA